MIRKRKNNFIAWLARPFWGRGFGNQPDLVLLVVVGFLLFFGLLFLSSASSTLAFGKHHDTYFFVKQQLLHGILPGLLLFYIALRINYKVYEKLAYLFLIVSLILLLLVVFTNLGNQYGTATSWINLGGISFQPSEFVKLFFILFLADWLSKKGNRIKNFKTGTLPFVIILSIISVLIIKQPDIGTLIIIALIALAMFFASGAKWSHLAAIISVGLAGLLVLIKAAPYRLSRFTAWLNPDIDPRGIGWQIKQSLIAVGSGGWLGLGLGDSRQKSYLPMPANDSIFAIIAEEIGFIFTLCFLALFVILMMRGFYIIRNAPDNFAKLTALGITVWLSTQIFINIAGIIQLLPLTGVPLSFVSLGGSNLVVTLVSIGILANISRFTNQR